MKFYINGEFKESHNNKILQVISPINQEILEKIPDGNQEDVNEAVKAAKEALESWSQTDYQVRRNLSYKFLEALESHRDEVVETIVKELGSPIEFSRKVQFDFYIKELKDLIDEAKDFEFTIHKKGFDLVKEPVGVIACITPWNYPLGQITKKIIPALLMGNTTVLKPSSQTPLTAGWIARAIDEAGFPKGVFNLITGKGSKMGHFLTSHPDVNMITFTGSTDVGVEVAEMASKEMKRIAMELGGKSVSIILKDADMDIALKKTLDSVFLNSGQTCSALTRLLISLEEKEKIENLLIEKSKEYQVGNPFKENIQMGPVQSFTQFETIKKYVELGLEEGAKLLVGEVPKDMKVKPTIFTDVSNDMRIAREEIFGPVLCVITYKTVEEAIEIANDSRYGLSGGVYGPQEKAIEVAKKLKTGNVFVNTVDKALNVPFGGYKYSGIGRENGIEGLEEFIELKAIIL